MDNYQCQIGASRHIPVANLTVAVDGHAAASSQEPEASWGYVFAWPPPAPLSSDASLPPLEEHFGPVALDPNHSDFLGAEKLTNNSAEISGLGHIFRWLLFGSVSPTRVDILYDSSCAANITRRVWKAKTNILLANQVQRLFGNVCDQGFVVNWHHVRAHRGHFMNEAADKAADKGAARPGR